MKLDLERTAKGKSSLEIDSPVATDFGEGGPQSVSLKGALTVTNLDSRFLLSGVLEASGEAECGRCLQDYPLNYEVPVELVVLRDVDSDEGEGDTLTIHQRSGEVDLTPALREVAVLAVPQARICSETCRGYCAQCGTDLNKESCSCSVEETDPRWDGLPD